MELVMLTHTGDMSPGPRPCSVVKQLDNTEGEAVFMQSCLWTRDVGYMRFGHRT
jgi:predicted metal-binding protein